MAEQPPQQQQQGAVKKRRPASMYEIEAAPVDSDSSGGSAPTLVPIVTSEGKMEEQRSRSEPARSDVARAYTLLGVAQRLRQLVAAEASKLGALQVDVDSVSHVRALAKARLWYLQHAFHRRLRKHLHLFRREHNIMIQVFGQFDPSAFERQTRRPTPPVPEDLPSSESASTSAPAAPPVASASGANTPDARECEDGNTTFTVEVDVVAAADEDVTEMVEAGTTVFSSECTRAVTEDVAAAGGVSTEEVSAAAGGVSTEEVSAVAGGVSTVEVSAAAAAAGGVSTEVSAVAGGVSTEVSAAAGGVSTEVSAVAGGVSTDEVSAAAAAAAAAVGGASTEEVTAAAAAAAAAAATRGVSTKEVSAAAAGGVSTEEVSAAAAGGASTEEVSAAAGGVSTNEMSAAAGGVSTNEVSAAAGGVMTEVSAAAAAAGGVSTKGMPAAWASSVSIEEVAAVSPQSLQEMSATSDTTGDLQRLFLDLSDTLRQHIVVAHIILRQDKQRGLLPLANDGMAENLEEVLPKPQRLLMHDVAIMHSQMHSTQACLSRVAAALQQRILVVRPAPPSVQSPPPKTPTPPRTPTPPSARGRRGLARFSKLFRKPFSRRK